MPTDGPKGEEAAPAAEKKGGGGRTPTTTIIESHANELKKQKTSGGPDRGYSGGGKQGSYRQPY